MATNCTEVIRLLCGKFCVVDTIKCRLVSRGWKEAVDDENRSSWCKPCKCCRNNWRQKSPYPTSVYPLKRVTTSLNAYYVKKCSGFLEYIESLPHEQLSTDVYRSQNDIVTKMDLPLEWSLLDFTLQTNIHQIETLMKQWASLYSRSVCKCKEFFFYRKRE